MFQENPTEKARGGNGTSQITATVLLGDLSTETIIADAVEECVSYLETVVKSKTPDDEGNAISSDRRIVCVF